MNRRIRPALTLALIIAAAFAGGCVVAGGGSGSTALDAGGAKAKKKGLFGASRVETGRFGADGSYEPSNDERGLGCKRLRGKMGVRIAQLRSTNRALDASALARGLSGIFGGAKHGLDAAAQARRDRAILVTYNRLLAVKNCPTVDLDAALDQAPSAARGPAIKPQTR